MAKSTLKESLMVERKVFRVELDGLHDLEGQPGLQPARRAALDCIGLPKDDWTFVSVKGFAGLDGVVHEVHVVAERVVSDRGQISDGFHTFEELYEHRNTLFVALCNLCMIPGGVWKSKLHADGTMYPGYFIAGQVLGKEVATYHLPLKYWDWLRAEERERAPEWDGHTPADVVKLIQGWFFPRLSQ